MSKLWTLIGGLFALMAAALLYVTGQRDRAQELSDRAKRDAEARQAMIDAERAIARAKAEAHKKAIEVQREHDKHKEAGTRPEFFGDSRLHYRRDS